MTPADGDLLVSFYAGLSDVSLHFFRPHDPSPEKLRQLISAIPEEPNVGRFAAIYTSEEREEMAGYVFLWDLDTKVPWVGVCVRDSYQGGGLGTRLMRHAEQLCQKLGKGGILLTTHKENIKAQALYNKLGYEAIGTDNEDEILMIKRFIDENWRAKTCG